MSKQKCPYVEGVSSPGGQPFWNEGWGNGGGFGYEYENALCAYTVYRGVCKKEDTVIDQ